MKESNVVRKLLITTVVTVLAIPAIASATPHFNDRERGAVKVSYADLDLSSNAGLQILYSRLKTASQSVCGTHSLIEAGSLEQVIENKRCYSKALSKAVAKIDNEKLNEIHAG